MKLMPKLSKIVLIAIAVNLLMFCGCSKNKNNDEQQAKQMKMTEKSDKVPEDLENLESSIEKIIKALDGPSVSLKDEKSQSQSQSQEESEGESQSPSPQKPEQGGGQEGGEQNDQQSQDGEQKQDQGEGSQGQKTPQPTNNMQSNQNTASSPKDPWQEITPTINKLHYQWNGYLPSATKKNANRQLIDNFDDALNALTSTIQTKDKNKTLLAANNLYSYIPDFYMLYKTESSPEIKRIRYYARNVVLNSTTLNWDQAGKDIISLKATWAIYKNTIDPKNQDLSSKLDYSIYELEKVVTEKNQSLTDIKGRIAISNTEGLEKAAKESQEKS